MDFIKMYWIPLFLVLSGIFIPLFKINAKNKSKKFLLYQSIILVAFGVYLMVTKMFLEKNLAIITWLLGVFIILVIIKRFQFYNKTKT